RRSARLEVSHELVGAPCRAECRRWRTKINAAVGVTHQRELADRIDRQVRGGLRSLIAGAEAELDVARARRRQAVAIFVFGSDAVFGCGLTDRRATGPRLTGAPRVACKAARARTAHAACAATSKPA